MTQIHDGGPAFPPNAGWRDNDPKMRGMSLRDWFAGQALVGLLASGTHYCDHHGRVHDAYLHADAMLAKRAENGGAS